MSKIVKRRKKCSENLKKCRKSNEKLLSSNLLTHLAHCIFLEAQLLVHFCSFKLQAGPKVREAPLIIGAALKQGG